MVESKQQAPHFYVTHEYDVEALLALRTKINALLPDEDKLSVNDFIVKAVALALRQFPNLNAALRGDQVVQFGAVNIGVAVAVENGLLTVVCRDADRKPLRQISGELRTMTGRARQGKVRPEDIEGSTFSVSNLGMYRGRALHRHPQPARGRHPGGRLGAPGPGRQGWAGGPRLAHESHPLGRPPRQRWRRSRPLPAGPGLLPGGTNSVAIMKALFEKTRYLSLIAVVALLIAAFSSFIWGAIKTYSAIAAMFASLGQDKLISLYLIQLVDIFLISITLLIFAVSIYELFIGDLDLPEWMLAHNLHDLKARLSSLAILVLAMKFVEKVFEGLASLQTLYLGLAIAVVSAVLIAFSYFGSKD